MPAIILEKYPKATLFLESGSFRRVLGEGLGWPGSRKALGELRTASYLPTDTEEVQYLTKGLATQVCISWTSNLLRTMLLGSGNPSGGPLVMKLSPSALQTVPSIICKSKLKSRLTKLENGERVWIDRQNLSGKGADEISFWQYNFKKAGGLLFYGLPSLWRVVPSWPNP